MITGVLFVCRLRVSVCRRLRRGSGQEECGDEKEEADVERMEAELAVRMLEGAEPGSNAGASE
jgi:hypothetical protein